METWILAGIIMLAALVVLLASGWWLGLSLALVGVFAGIVFTDVPVWDIVTRLQFSQSVSYTFLAVPMFIFMGQAMAVSGVVQRLYEGLAPWTSRLPGKLLQTNVVTCSVVSATTGSTVATAATIGGIAVPELRRRGYPDGPIVGSIGGASLGLLVPPSLYFILFGMMTGESISALYIAGLLPAILILAMFMIYIGILSTVRKDTVPSETEPYTLRDYLRGLPNLAPALGLIVAVLGSVYLGIATVTEAAAVGSAGALALMIGYRTLSVGALRKAARETIRITGMVMLIYMGASVMANFVGYLGIPTELARLIEESAVQPWVVMSLIIVMYFFLGMFLEGMSMMLLTVPVVFPIIVDLGYDPIWFAVVLAILIEVGQMTPPLGFILFVLQNAAMVPIGTVIRSIIPYVIIMLLSIFILFIFPEIATFLPTVM